MNNQIRFLTALGFLAAGQIAVAGTWFVNLSAESLDGGDPANNFSQVSGTLGYNSNTGGTVTLGPDGGTTYSNPTALGLTSAISQTSSTLNINDFCDPSSCVTGILTSSAMAKGNLATGTVGVYGFPSFIYSVPRGTCDGCPPGGTGSDAYATAELSDNLTFNVAGANSGTVTDIGVSFTVDGNQSIGPEGNAFLTAVMRMGGIISYSFDSENSPGTQNQIVENSGWVSSQIVAESPNSFIFNGVYALDGVSSTVPVLVELQTQCLEQASCDFSNTGAISFALPSNVTFTSDSGVFLTQTTPEPASWGMMLGGLLLVAGGVVRRKRIDPGFLALRAMG